MAAERSGSRWSRPEREKTWEAVNDPGPNGPCTDGMRVLLSDSIDQLFRAEHDRLWRSLVAHCGDVDLATEAEAEAFTQALARGDELVDPKAWLWRAAFKIAGGLLADRRRNASTTVTDPAFGYGFDQPSAGEPASDASLAEFVDLLQGLSDQQRSVVVLRYAAGFLPAEIADVLGTSPGPVRVQLHRAHTQLRDQMGS